MNTKKLKDSRLGIIMPTYRAEAVFTRLIPSLKYISEISETSVFLINYNGRSWGSEFLRNKADEAIRHEGFEVRSIYSADWTKPVNLIQMRTMCAELDPQCDIYMFCDDDNRFVSGTPSLPEISSGIKYRHAIDYMTRYPRCGIISVKGFLGGYQQAMKIIPIWNDVYSTNRGLILRNMGGHGFLLFPEETHNGLVGGLEEMLAVMARLERGYFPAKMMNCPTVNISGKLHDYDDDPCDFHNVGVINDNIGDYLLIRYGWFWEEQERHFPKSLWESYKENKGIELTNDLIVDYKYYEL